MSITEDLSGLNGLKMPEMERKGTPRGLNPLSPRILMPIPGYHKQFVKNIFPQIFHPEKWFLPFLLNHIYL